MFLTMVFGTVGSSDEEKLLDVLPELFAFHGVDCAGCTKVEHFSDQVAMSNIFPASPAEEIMYSFARQLLHHNLSKASFMSSLPLDHERSERRSEHLWSNLKLQAVEGTLAFIKDAVDGDNWYIAARPLPSHLLALYLPSFVVDANDALYLLLPRWIRTPTVKSFMAILLIVLLAVVADAKGASILHASWLLAGVAIAAAIFGGATLAVKGPLSSGVAGAFVTIDTHLPWPVLPEKTNFEPAAELPWGRARRVLRGNTNATLVASSPDIWIVPDFLNSSAADALVLKAKDRFSRRHPHPELCLSRESVIKGLIATCPSCNLKYTRGMMCTDDARAFQFALRQENVSTSRASFFASSLDCDGSACDKAISELDDAVEQQAGLRLADSLSWQVMEYQRGDYYKPHLDCRRNVTEPFVNRAATLLLYLEEPGRGGETCFPERKLCITPRKGTAIFFQSLNGENQCDERSRHESMQVAQGSKIVLQKWYHSEELPVGDRRHNLRDRDHVICDDGMNCRHYLFPHQQSQPA